MPLKVIRAFQDLSDPEKHFYELDAVFPREGFEPSEEFTSGLLTGNNSAGSIFLVDEGSKESTEKDTEEKPKRKRGNKKDEG